MKILTAPIFALLLSTVFVSCDNGSGDPEAVVSDAKEVTDGSKTGIAYQIDTNSSLIKWEGHKTIDPTQRRHEGIVTLSSGTLIVDNATVNGGSFKIDMTSISLSDQDKKNLPEDKQGNLVGHLKSDEFFSTEKYPTAEFEITSSKPLDSAGYNTFVYGNLTIRDKKKNIGFPAKLNVNGDKATADARVIIDRSDFDVKYNSSNFVKNLAADDIISNDITMDIHLEATKAK
ncbi:MAG: YceI family protein [Bacteroidota bacterium]|nr:YceI family protein [Bacteroidota bacterium]